MYQPVPRAARKAVEETAGGGDRAEQEAWSPEPEACSLATT